VAAAILGFARALGEFGATIIIAGGIPGQTQTLSVAIFNLTEAGRTRTTGSCWCLWPGLGGCSSPISFSGEARYDSAGLRRAPVAGRLLLDVADAADVSAKLFAVRQRKTRCSTIAGLRVPSRGRVSIDGRCWTRRGPAAAAPASRRLRAQDGALFPHLDARRNVRPAPPSPRPPPRLRQTGRRAARPDTDHICATSIAHRWIAVSAICRRRASRVAIARALVSSPRILLLDEPLAGVDRGRKDHILPYLLRIRRELHVPMVYVTHDARELGEIADRVLRLEEGRLVDVGDPGEVLARAEQQRWTVPVTDVPRGQVP
jgi:molybdate transport system ATP-binding protein